MKMDAREMPVELFHALEARARASCRGIESGGERVAS
jgi:hypothetical protein